MSARKPSQNDRVLYALARAGDTGLGPVAFLPPVVDGGKPITRLAARIGVLRGRGYQIPNLARKNEVARYVLAPEQRAEVLARRLPPSPQAAPAPDRRHAARLRRTSTAHPGQLTIDPGVLPS